VEALAVIGGLLDRTQVDRAGIAYQVTGLGLDVLPRARDGRACSSVPVRDRCTR
jgi:hypothetical protein